MAKKKVELKKEVVVENPKVEVVKEINSNVIKNERIVND